MENNEKQKTDESKSSGVGTWLLIVGGFITIIIIAKLLLDKYL
jgi:hypothetical protein